VGSGSVGVALEVAEQCIGKTMLAFMGHEVREQMGPSVDGAAFAVELVQVVNC